MVHLVGKSHTLGSTFGMPLGLGTCVLVCLDVLVYFWHACGLENLLYLCTFGMPMYFRTCCTCVLLACLCTSEPWHLCARMSVPVYLDVPLQILYL